MFASQPWRVSNGSIWILAIQGAGAVAAHGALDVICSSRETRTYSTSTKMIRLSLIGLVLMLDSDITTKI